MRKLLPLLIICSVVSANAQVTPRLQARNTDFQKSSRALVEHLIKVLPTGEGSEIEAAMDLEILTDEFMGVGAWSKINDGEREQMSSAYRRLLYEIVEGHKRDDPSQNKIRLLHLEEKGDVAEAICLQPPLDVLLKFRLTHRNDRWYLVEILQADTNLHLFSEILQPAIATIQTTRAGQKAPPADTSDFIRVLSLAQKDSEKAVVVANDVLKVKPGDKGIRFLKALALLELKKNDEAVELLRELSNEAFAPAAYKLADHLHFLITEKDQKESIEFYERYLSLEPHDARAFGALAIVYENAENLVKAEAAYRKAAEYDPGSSDKHLTLIDFLFRYDRFAEVKPLLVAAEKHLDGSEDIFGMAMHKLYLMREYQQAEKLAASERLRMKTSAQANLVLGQTYLAIRRYTKALRLLNTAAQLDKKSSTPHATMALVYRQMSDWTAALKSAEHAISLDDKDADAHFQRACALSRLGRLNEAMSALEKAVELDPEQRDLILDEKDLKPLAPLPAFKKLMPEYLRP